MREHKNSNKPDSLSKYECRCRPTLHERTGPNVKFSFINALTKNQTVCGHHTTPIFGISSVCLEARITGIPRMLGECNAWNCQKNLIGTTIICHNQATFEPLIRWEANVMCVLLPVKVSSSDFAVIGRNQRQMQIRMPPGIPQDLKRYVPFKQSEGN